MKLCDVTKGRNNNLDLIRFIAAMMVIFSHAFPLSLGVRGGKDYLSMITRSQISFGGLAVSIFFFYGGFLICKSAHRLQSAKKYFKARMIRIFPSLVVVIVCTTFLIGPILSVLSIREYFTNPFTYQYLLNSILILVHDLPGVFENNIYGTTVNGSLWTLPVEFVGYILCFFMMKMNLLKSKYLKWIVPIFILVHITISYLSSSQTLVSSVWTATAMFFIGMLYDIYQDKICLSKRIVIINIILLLFSIWLKILNITMPFFLSYILIYLGYGTNIKFSNFARYGEISYGIYLCGFPIQQIVCERFGGSMNPIVNAAISIPLAIICGFLLHRYIEKPILNIVNKNKT